MFTFDLLLFLSALEEFFTSLVKQEMVNMPRGVYHSALKGGARLDQGKTVAGIPNFMLKMYEANKQPGLKPGLAGKHHTSMYRLLMHRLKFLFQVGCDWA